MKKIITIFSIVLTIALLCSTVVFAFDRTANCVNYADADNNGVCDNRDSANCGLSVAKYNIYLQLIDKGIQITTDEVCNTGMHHLRELLEQNALQTNTDTTAPVDPSSECKTQESCGATAHNEAKQHGKYK